MAAHGGVGGLGSVMQGGKFYSGFVSAALPQLASRMGILPPVGKGNRMGNTFYAAMVGGTGSVLGGGKFANGAVTGAFSRLFGEAAASQQEKDRSLTANEIRESLKAGNSFSYYDKTRIIDGSFLPFQNVPMAPDGNIYWPSGNSGFKLHDDFTLSGDSWAMRTFIHEMAHVSEFYNGTNILEEGMWHQTLRTLSFGSYNPYTTPNGNLEYRAESVANNYCLVSPLCN